MSVTSQRANFLSFTGRAKIVHLTWFAFFVTFLVWFSHAPLLLVIQEAMGLSDQQIKTLLILNVALTIPARIVTGMLVDVYGPRKTYSAMLAQQLLPLACQLLPYYLVEKMDGAMLQQ